MTGLVRALKLRLINHKHAGIERDHKVGQHVIALPPDDLFDAYQDALVHDDNQLPLMVARLVRQHPTIVEAKDEVVCRTGTNLFDIDERHFSPQRGLTGLKRRMSNLRAEARA
jgi:hypothetical protein